MYGGLEVENVTVGSIPKTAVEPSTPLPMAILARLIGGSGSVKYVFVM